MSVVSQYPTGKVNQDLQMVKHVEDNEIDSRTETAKETKTCSPGLMQSGFKFQYQKSSFEEMIKAPNFQNSLITKEQA